MRIVRPLLAIPLCLVFWACCDAPPAWEEIDPLTVGAGVEVPVDLATYASGTDLSFSVEAQEGVRASIEGDTLSLIGETGFSGYSKVRLTATDACGASSTTSVTVTVPYSYTDGNTCPATLTAPAGPAAVAVAGTFNGWSTLKTPMEKQADGSFSLTLSLLPGGYAYKFVKDGEWVCDSTEAQIMCDEGQSWEPDCPTGSESCNSMFVVDNCNDPTITVSRVSIDRDTNGIEVEARGDRNLSGTWATLDGEEISVWEGSRLVVARSGLSEGRHTLRFGADGADDVFVPFWLDDQSWETGLLYFAFVDRFFDGSSSNNDDEGATVDYAGGDWVGLTAKLNYLDEMGVTALWLTAPVDNAEGAWDGQCSATYAGYHGYWPDGSDPEEHFGTEAELEALVKAAHDLGMRVLIDWVGNHVHETHDLYEENAQWFNERHICEQDDDGDGIVNWDQRPESCWFATYLPDVDYSQEDAMEVQLNAAIDMAKRWDLDGFRIDAVKHMPESVFVNLEHRIQTEIEYRGVGGDEDFRTIGETFDSYDRIAQYIGDGELDSQFDFPLYYSILAAFARDEIGLSNGDGSLQSSLTTSRNAYGGALMSTFLGNHDVGRFIAHASGEISSAGGDSPCGSDGKLLSPDTAPGWSEPYDRLRLAWTFLLTTEGLPLIYYGDEIGLPGYADPDNRQMMRFDSALSADESDVLAHVQALGQARRDHPAFSTGTRTDWWENDADTWAYARVSSNDAVLVILNRSDSERTFTNGLAFASLPEGTYTDILSGASFSSSGDSLSVPVGAGSSVVLVPG